MHEPGEGLREAAASLSHRARVVLGQAFSCFIPPDASSRFPTSLFLFLFLPAARYHGCRRHLFLTAPPPFLPPS